MLVFPFNPLYLAEGLRVKPLLSDIVIIPYHAQEFFTVGFPQGN